MLSKSSLLCLDNKKNEFVELNAKQLNFFLGELDNMFIWWSSATVGKIKWTHVNLEDMGKKIAKWHQWALQMLLWNHHWHIFYKGMSKTDVLHGSNPWCSVVSCFDQQMAPNVRTAADDDVEKCAFG